MRFKLAIADLILLICGIVFLTMGISAYYVSNLASWKCNLTMLMGVVSLILAAMKENE